MWKYLNHRPHFWYPTIDFRNNGPRSVKMLTRLCVLNIKNVKSSHYFLYSAFNNENYIKAALLYQLDIKLVALHQLYSI